MTPSPNYVLSFDFLKTLRNKGPWSLTAILNDSGEPLVGGTFTDKKSVLAFLEKHGGERNLYYALNPLLGNVGAKAGREDVKEMAWLHVDVDPRAGEGVAKEQERILQMFKDGKGVPEPSLVVFSGGGYQALWRLNQPVEINGEEEKYEEAKRYNQQLELIFGADPCHNVDRIMRLPGSINRPNQKKQKKGRVPALAEVVSNSGLSYDITEFTPAPSVQDGGGGFSTGHTVKMSSGNVERISLDKLPKGVSDELKHVIAHGKDRDDDTRFESRSEAVFYVCCEMVRSDCEDETIFAVLTDKDYAISSSILEKRGSADRYATRQIERAREHAHHPRLMEMNEKHAVIGDIGGKCRAISEVYDHAMGRHRISRQSFDDLRNRYMHIKVDMGVNAQGMPVQKPLGAWWLGQEKRRQYDTMVFAPGRDVPNAYNLWKGFACDARPGDCSLFLDHLKDNICRGIEAHYDYLIGWMATAVQKPDSPGQVAVVMRGRMGTGKGVAIKGFGHLFGRHFLQVSDPKHLVGSFNSHLRDCCVLFGDEAFYAGDVKHSSMLKTLITEEMLTIEAKGVDAEISNNCVHLLMASNSEWVVPAGLEERRFFVLDVGNQKMQNSAYFGKIAEQMKSGGQEALLHHLLTHNLEKYDVRKVPQTDALQQQKLLSLSPEEEWWYNKLKDGRALQSHASWEAQVFCEELLDDYIHYTQRFNIARRGNATRLGQFLTKACPPNKFSKVQVSGQAYVETRLQGRKLIPRPYAYHFPELEEMRTYWDNQFFPCPWVKMKDIRQVEGSEPQHQEQESDLPF